MNLFNTTNKLMYCRPFLNPENPSKCNSQKNPRFAAQSKNLLLFTDLSTGAHWKDHWYLSNCYSLVWSLGSSFRFFADESSGYLPLIMYLGMASLNFAIRIPNPKTDKSGYTYSEPRPSLIRWDFWKGVFFYMDLFSDLSCRLISPLA